jgi:hypothetical protein
VTLVGPLTLLRPAVATAAVAYGVVPDPRWQLLTVGTIILIPGTLLELHLERRMPRTLLRRAEPPGPPRALDAPGDIRPQLALI